MSASPLAAYGLPAPLRSLVDAFQERRALTTADKSLALRMRDAVRRSDLKVAGISVHVSHGAVSVYGAVRDASEREALLGLVARQPGVTRIVDHLRLAEA